MDLVKERLAHRCFAPTLKDANLMAHRYVWTTRDGDNLTVSMIGDSQETYSWTSDNAAEVRKVEDTARLHNTWHATGNQNGIRRSDLFLPTELQAHQQ